VRISLLPVEKFGRASPYACTLDKIVGNIENFYKDFRNGGWIAYEEAGKLQNNYYGALWLSWYGRDQYVASKLAAANAKINANGGFLSVELCRDKKTGLKVSEDEMKQRQLAGGALGGGLGYSAANDVVCEDTTPGSYVGATLEKAVGVDFDYIVNAQQLSDYAAAITNALINRVIKEGVNGLRGVTGGQAQTGDTGTYYRGGNLPRDLQTSGDSYLSGNYAVAQSGLRGQITTAISDRKVAQTNYTVLINREKTLLASLQILSKCLVGPLQIAATTQTSINDQNTAIATLQRNIDDNISKIALLKSSLEKLNNLTDKQAELAFKPESLAQITSDVSSASNLRSETTTIVENLQADFDARNNAVLEDQKIYCASSASASSF
jgi:hypothetical protein